LSAHRSQWAVQSQRLRCSPAAATTTLGVPAAIANAVFDATGRRVTDLPIKLERLL
jgi:hypothetical protein